MPLEDNTDEPENLGTGTSTGTVSWIYLLSRNQLESCAQGFGLDTTGTVEELRKRLSAHLKARLTNPGGNAEHRANPPPPEDDNLEDDPRSPKNPCDKVRKWGLNFDGVGDAVSFLERVKELRDCYDLSDEEILAALPLLFRNQALLWYRNNRSMWTTWKDFLDDFKLQYLPSRYDYMIEEQVRSRFQGPREPFKDYLTDMLTLIRRGKAMTPRAILERVYNNMRPEYKLYARRNTFTSLRELSALAAEYEQIQREQEKASKIPENIPFSASSSNRRGVASTSGNRDSRPSTPTTSSQIPLVSSGSHPQKLSNPERRCWRCGSEGHRRSQCRNRAVLFCSRCGTMDISSRDCGCPGNASVGVPRG